MKGKLFIILAILAAAGGAWWWHGQQGEAKKIHYLTETARRMTIRKTVNATGEIDAVRLVTVGAQASGKIIELRVEIGQKVSKGDLIAQIDPTTQTNALKSARAQLDTYNAQLESRKVALAVAQTKYNREARLKKSGSTSSANLEDAENALAAAKASVREMESQIIQQQISVNTAETNLGYTRIIAPLDGTVVAVPVKEGQTVNANQTTPTIAQIADLSSMEIKIEVSEGDIPFIKPGQRVRYTLLGAPDQPFRTSITAIDPGDKTLSNATSSSSSLSSSTTSASTNSAVYYYAKARVPNPDGLLRLGMTTQNVIEIDKAENVLAIPTITIQSKGRGKKFVRVLENGTPVEKEVQTGITNNVMTEIQSGLTEGEQIISTQMTEDERKASLATRGGRRPH